MNVIKNQNTYTDFNLEVNICFLRAFWETESTNGNLGSGNALIFALLLSVDVSQSALFVRFSDS